MTSERGMVKPASITIQKNESPFDKKRGAIIKLAPSSALRYSPSKARSGSQSHTYVPYSYKKTIPNYRIEAIEPDEDPPKEPPLDNQWMETLRVHYWDKTDFSDLEASIRRRFIRFLYQYAEHERNENFENTKIAYKMISNLKLAGKIETNKKQDEDDELHVCSRFEKREEDLQERHDKEIENFESKWKNVILFRYRKPTSHLLQLNFCKRQLLSTKRPEEAAQLDREIQVNLKEESINAQTKLSRAYEEARDLLMKRQKLEKDTLAKEKKTQLEIVNLRKQRRQQQYDALNAVVEVQEANHVKRPPTKGVGEVCYYHHLQKREDNIPQLGVEVQNDPEVVKRREMDRKRRMEESNAAQQKRVQAELAKYAYSSAGSKSGEDSKEGEMKYELKSSGFFRADPNQVYHFGPDGTAMPLLGDSKTHGSQDGKTKPSIKGYQGSEHSKYRARVSNDGWNNK